MRKSNSDRRLPQPGRRNPAHTVGNHEERDKTSRQRDPDGEHPDHPDALTVVPIELVKSREQCDDHGDEPGDDDDLHGVSDGGRRV